MKQFLLEMNRINIWNYNHLVSFMTPELDDLIQQKNHLDKKPSLWFLSFFVQHEFLSNRFLIFEPSLERFRPWNKFHSLMEINIKSPIRKLNPKDPAHWENSCFMATAFISNGGHPEKDNDFNFRIAQITPKTKF